MEIETPEVKSEAPERGYTEEQAAEELLKRWTKDKPESDKQDNPEESTDTPETESVDEGEEPQEDEDTEIDVAGEKFKLPKHLKEQAERIQAKAKEVEAGATRKFQESAEARKLAEAHFKQAEKLHEVVSAHADIFADYKAVNNRLAQLAKVDANALSQADPVALTRLNAEFNQLQLARGQIENALRNAAGNMEKVRSEAQKAKIAEIADFATKNIKGWSDDYSNKLLDYVVNDIGAPPEEIQGNMSKWLVKLIDKAYRGDAVQSAKPWEKKATGKQSTLTPGASGRPQGSAQKAFETAQTRLKKTGSLEDAAVALLARSKLRKR